MSQTDEAPSGKARENHGLLEPMGIVEPVVVDQDSEKNSCPKRCVIVTLIILAITNIACLAWVATIAARRAESSELPIKLELQGTFKKLESMESHNEELSLRLNALETKVVDKVLMKIMESKSNLTKQIQKQEDKSREILDKLRGMEVEIAQKQADIKFLEESNANTSHIIATVQSHVKEDVQLLETLVDTVSKLNFSMKMIGQSQYQLASQFDSLEDFNHGVLDKFAGIEKEVSQEKTLLHSMIASKANTSRQVATLEARYQEVCEKLEKLEINPSKNEMSRKLLNDTVARTVQKVEVLQVNYQELLLKFNTSIGSVQNMEVSKNHPSFVAVRRGGFVYSGIITFNETLYSTPNTSFSAQEGTFKAPLPGTYSFSFSGTSFCGEAQVLVQVNKRTILKYYDRNGTWKNSKGLTYSYYRGWTQVFALQLEVGDSVRLFAVCNSYESSWGDHQPGAAKEHKNHKCFSSMNGYLYFLGQYMG